MHNLQLPDIFLIITQKNLDVQLFFFRLLVLLNEVRKNCRHNSAEYKSAWVL